MATSSPSIAVPIQTDDHGTIRIAGTRVTLDVVIARFQQGATPEQIHDSFPSLKRGDIYAVISYYLHNQDEVDTYLRRQDEEADFNRHQIEAERPELFDLQTRLRERTSK